MTIGRFKDTCCSLLFMYLYLAQFKYAVQLFHVPSPNIIAFLSNSMQNKLPRLASLTYYFYFDSTKLALTFTSVESRMSF